jgi:ABC-2 type transport system permease protein
MLKLIHAELYKIFHRAYFFVMILCLAALCVTMVFELRGGGYGNWSGAVGIAASMLTYPVVILPMLTQIVSAEEFRDHTLKNTLAFGTDRSALYVAKWLTAVFLGVLLMVTVLVVYGGSAVLLLPKDAAFTGEVLREFFTRLGAACVVYIACISMSIFFISWMNRSTLAIFLYYGAFYLADLFFTLFHFDKGIDYLLKTQLSNMLGNSIVQLQTPVVISLVTMVVFFAAGLAIFRKKDLC